MTDTDLPEPAKTASERDGLCEFQLGYFCPTPRKGKIGDPSSPGEGWLMPSHKRWFVRTLNQGSQNRENPMILVLANSSQMLFSISRYAHEFREEKDHLKEAAQERD